MRSSCIIPEYVAPKATPYPRAITPRPLLPQEGTPNPLSSSTDWPIEAVGASVTGFPHLLTPVTPSNPRISDFLIIMTCVGALGPLVSGVGVAMVLGPMELAHMRQGASSTTDIMLASQTSQARLALLPGIPIP